MKYGKNIKTQKFVTNIVGRNKFSAWDGFYLYIVICNLYIVFLSYE